LLSGYVLPYAINILLFYFHALVVMPLCFAPPRPRVILFLLLLLTELVVYLALMALKDPGFFQGRGTYLFLFPSFLSFVQQLWRGIYFLIFSTAYWLIQRNFIRQALVQEAEKHALRKQQENKELELQLIASRNAFLQSQINPHLLFNTLNFIYNEVQQLSAKAADAVITLSDMMRYSLAEMQPDGKTDLAQEVEQIENMIRLNQFRFEQELFVDFKCEGDLAGYRIPPLVLLPFVENLFKHGNLTNATHPAEICLVVDQGIIHFRTHNRKQKNSFLPSTHIGIQNVKTRLNSIYQGRHQLEIIEEEGRYSVYLTLQV